MSLLFWLSLSSLAPLIIAALTLPSSNHTNNGNSLSNEPPSATNLSFPFILPYSWVNPDSGMFYRYGFSMHRVSLHQDDIAQLLAIAQATASEGAIQHGHRSLYPTEDNEQRFGVSSGVLEIRIANVRNARFSWLDLLDVLESLEIILVGGQRGYKTWFEFWALERDTERPPIGRGKLFRPGYGVGGSFV